MRFPWNSVIVRTLLAGVFIAAASAETVKDRKGAVLEDRSKMQDDERWIYNDWRRGFAKAKETGKPVLVVLRCVPCLACAGIDASILTEPGLQPLLDKFVCVRVINANDLDLSLFQFDYDLSFSTIVFNADRTVYGRYGSWTHQKDPYEKTTAGFRRTLESALKIHAAYPANKDSLAGKQGKAMPVSDPLQLPELAGKYERELDWDGKVVQSCVHCHQVGDAVRSMYRDQKKTIPREWIYPMPTPETIGLTLAPDAAATVDSVVKDSIAAKAGFQKGDEVLFLQGQPLISIADFAWVLNHSTNEANLSALVKRDGREIKMTVPLGRDWRLQSDISRRVATWPMRAMVLGGMLLEDLSDADRAERKIGTGGMALRAKHVGEYGNHALAKKAGLRKDDVIIKFGDFSARTTESELIGRLIEKHQPGERLEVTVLRGTEKIQASFQTQ